MSTETIVGRVSVQSDKYNDVWYTVSVTNEGNYFCECPAFTYSSTNDCKHIRRALPQLNQQLFEAQQAQDDVSDDDYWGTVGESAREAEEFPFGFDESDYSEARGEYEREEVNEQTSGPVELQAVEQTPVDEGYVYVFNGKLAVGDANDLLPYIVSSIEQRQPFTIDGFPKEVK